MDSKEKLIQEAVSAVMHNDLSLREAMAKLYDDIEAMNGWYNKVAVAELRFKKSITKEEVNQHIQLFGRGKR